MIRGTVRPFAGSVDAGAARPARAPVSTTRDHYVQGRPSARAAIGSVTFEHTYVNAGFEYLDAADQTSVTRAEGGQPRLLDLGDAESRRTGWEGLLRYDHLTPNDGDRSPDARRATIVGVAYWFPHQGNVSTRR